MARVTLRQLLDHAAEQGYAVPAFNINNMEQALAIMARHGALEAARADALGWAATARGALGPLPAGPIRDMLEDLADFVVSRIA